MTDQEKDGGSAFPEIATDHSGVDNEFSSTYSYGGMSLRDYFAGQMIHATVGYDFGKTDPSEAMKAAAAFAYAQADAMLRERAK